MVIRTPSLPMQDPCRCREFQCLKGFSGDSDWLALLAVKGQGLGGFNALKASVVIRTTVGSPNLQHQEGWFQCLKGFSGDSDFPRFRQQIQTGSQCFNALKASVVIRTRSWLN